MRTTCVLIAVFSAMMFGCKKSRPIGENEYVTLAYKQTYCSDPWPNGSNDSLTLQNVSNYLNSSGLYIASLSIKQDANPDSCKSCLCKSGKTIYVSTLNSSDLRSKYSQIGFR